MQSRSILFLFLVLLLGAGSAYLMVKKPVSLGLDIKGGLRVIYQMDVKNMTPAQLEIKSKIQDDLVAIFLRRATGSLGVSEPSVQKKGEDSFVIELPGLAKPEEARAVMSSTAKIIVYWAKTVGTEKRPNRRYDQSGDMVKGDVTYKTFVRTADSSKEIAPGTPEYADMIKTWEPILEGEEVSDALYEILGGDQGRPHFKFNASGAKKLEDWSRKYINQGELMAFVLDNQVLSINPIAANTVLSNEAELQGNYPIKWVKTLTEQIKAGSLPVGLIELSNQTVDPTIGKFALPQMVNAGIISLAIVCVLLIIYYAWPGVIATFAMLLYALFTVAFLNAFGATFSLASIAAFILSTGMAVDANILVFERLKEELRDGKELMKAVDIAFKRALTAIIDSNICTVMTCVMLYMFGTGQVKGFASTLGIGVIISFFTAFIVTRTLLKGLMALGLGRDAKWYGMGKGWFKGSQDDSTDVERKLLNIVGRSKQYFLLSLALIIPGFIFVAMGGIKTNVEFQGGYEGTYKLPAGMTVDAIRSGLEKKGFVGTNIKFAETSSEKVVYITVPPTGLRVDDPNINKNIAEAAGLSIEGSSFNSIGPTVQRETVQNAIFGVTSASILIMVYLAFRFGISVGGIKNGLKFGASAVIALVHDVLFVIGAAGIVGYFLHWEISALFITSMLTVIGFSVHDTIIIFDRVRENLRKPHKGETFEHLCDHSVTQSVARSINTTLSAVIPLAVLIAIGTPTPELKFMCLSMLLGISIGAYSSIFNATPILYMWNKAVMKKNGEQAGLMAESARETKLRAQQAAAAAGTMVPAAPAGATAGPASGSAYGQVKRRSGAIEKSKQTLDEDE